MSEPVSAASVPCELLQISQVSLSGEIDYLAPEC